jgi:methyl-accepting chemotaxis protein
LAVDALAARLAASVGAGAVAAALVALALSFFVTRAITRPIEQITESAEREGGPGIGEIRGPEEVQRLAAALRRAASSVGEQREAAQTERDRLATLIDELADAIFIADG